MEKLTPKVHAFSHYEFLPLKSLRCSQSWILIDLIHHSGEASEVAQKKSQGNEEVRLPWAHTQFEVILSLECKPLQGTVVPPYSWFCFLRNETSKK